MKKLKINDIDVFINENGLELKENSIYMAEYIFLIVNKHNLMSGFTDKNHTFCLKSLDLPNIDLKKGHIIKSVTIKLIKYLSETFIN